MRYAKDGVNHEGTWLNTYWTISNEPLRTTISTSKLISSDKNGAVKNILSKESAISNKDE